RSLDRRPRAPELDEARVWKCFCARLELPRAFEENDGVAVHVERAVAVEVRLELGEGHGLALDPARELVAQALEADLDAVLGVHAVRDDVELELTDGADDPFALAALGRAEELDRSFLRELLEALLQLLALQRIEHDHAPEMLGRELRERRVANRRAA